MDTNVFWSIIGIVGSAVIGVVLYLLAERKTIGAKRQTINSLYNEIVKTLFRTLVHERYIPSIEEMNRIIVTKAAENGLRPTTLPEPLEFVDAVYTRIVQDDVLTGQKRKQLVQIVNEYIRKNTEGKSEDYENYESDSKEKALRTFLVGMSSSLAVGVTFLATIKSTTPFSTSKALLLLITLLITISVVYTLSQVRKFREGTIVTSTSTRQQEYVSFEADISKILKSKAKTTSIIPVAGKTLRPDYLIKKGGKKYFIEVKYFSSFVPFSVVTRLNRYATDMKQAHKNSIAILVLNNKKAISNHMETLREKWDYVFDYRELKEFLNKEL